MRIMAFIKDYKIVKKILDFLGIYEFGRYKSPPKVLAVAYTFDDWRYDNHINNDYTNFYKYDFEGTLACSKNRQKTAPAKLLKSIIC